MLEGAGYEIALTLAVSMFVSSSKAPLRRKSANGEFMIDRLKSATSCFDIRLMSSDWGHNATRP